MVTGDVSATFLDLVVLLSFVLVATYGLCSCVADVINLLGYQKHLRYVPRAIGFSIMWMAFLSAALLAVVKTWKRVGLRKSIEITRNGLTIVDPGHQATVLEAAITAPVQVSVRKFIGVGTPTGALRLQLGRRRLDLISFKPCAELQVLRDLILTRIAKFAAESSERTSEYSDV